MEFLDEQAKRQRTVRLFTAYALIAIIILMASFLLVYLAQGYGYSTQKGVVQNGLVFINSNPISSTITIDGISRGNTDLRTVLPEGKHTVELKKANYRSWSKSFNLDGGSVLYFSYPILFPQNITVGVNKVFATLPALASQSLNRHWLIVQAQGSLPNLTLFDLQKPDDEPKNIIIPASILYFQGNNIGTLKALDWSDDNRHLLLSETMADGRVAYLLIDRQDINQSINLTEQLQLASGDLLALRNKKYDTYYVHNMATGVLKKADLKNGLSPNPTLAGVVQYKSHGDDLIFYVTYDGAKSNEAKLFVLNKQSKFQLKSLVRDVNNTYLLNMSTYQNNWQYVAGSISGNKIFIFRNPLNRDKPNNKTLIVPQMSLNFDNPKFATFSNNTRFISVQSGKKFIVYDIEQNSLYKFESSYNIRPDQQAVWMDGHRLSVVTDSKVRVFEFDGANQQTLTPSRDEFAPYFDRDYTHIYTLIPQADGKIGFESGKLVAN